MRSYRHCRRGAVAVLFAISLIPIVGLTGLAIDFGFWLQVKSRLDVAANVAAINGAKVATNALVTGDANYQAEGQNAAALWFTSQLGAYSAYLNKNNPVVSVSTGPNITVSVQYAGTLPVQYGAGVLGTYTMALSGEVDALAVTAPYLNVDIMLDNSGSMDIAASNTDISTMQQLTACSPSGAYMENGKGGYTSPASGQSYNAFSCSSGGHSYDGGLQCTPNFPVADPPYTYTGLVANGASMGPTCQGMSWFGPPSYPYKDGTYPLAGAPCAFACHFDGSKPAGEGNDYWAMARSTIGQANQVTLRFDLVKAATNQVISAMQADNLSINNLNVGIFTFNLTLNRVYPSTGEAGGDWATAIADVGAPPTQPNQPDTGIQPYCCGNDTTTDFTDTMQTLSTTLTAAGTGLAANSPRKVLFVITDGLQDYTPAAGRTMSAIDPASCQLFKNMGYVVYVVYTPYYPLMNAFYLENIYGIAEGTGTSSLTYNLQACASSPADYIEAGDATTLNNALQSFLKNALTQPARFTR
jgi:Flp pilus assembly protein TadG